MHTERKHAVIVVVDDEPGIRSLFEMILSRLGHTVSCAVSVSDGLVACAAARPDVVIVDMVMPGGNGLGLIHALRGTTPSPRIIAISGGGTEKGFDLLLKAREAGADVTLRKPVPMDLIVEVVEGLLH